MLGSVRKFIVFIEFKGRNKSVSYGDKKFHHFKKH